MARIELLIRRVDHAPALSVGHRLTAIRMCADISIATATGWSAYERAVVDTGAPVSLLPPAIWRQSQHVALGRVWIGGVARGKQCQIPAILAHVECLLSDGTHSLGPLRMYAYLAEIEDVPALIGVLGFIERGVMRTDLPHDRAFLRMT